MRHKKIERCNGRIQPRRNEQVLSAWANTASQLWQKACEFDGIPPDSKFVVFSSENKYARFHGLAMQRYFEAQHEAKAGGYVGLTLSGVRQGQ